jgi:hypothetical protein
MKPRKLGIFSNRNYLQGILMRASCNEEKKPCFIRSKGTRYLATWLCLILPSVCLADPLGHADFSWEVTALFWAALTAIWCLLFIMLTLLRTNTSKAYFILTVLCGLRFFYLIGKHWWLSRPNNDHMPRPLHWIAIVLWCLSMLTGVLKWKRETAAV